MEATLSVLNDLESRGLLTRYAIGGAMALLFHTEPVATFDLDIFCLIPEEGPIVTMSTCYVLGASIDPLADEESSEGNTIIIPRRYNAVLGQAHARTFNLLKKVENTKNVKVSDADLYDVIYPDQEELLHAFNQA